MIPMRPRQLWRLLALIAYGAILAGVGIGFGLAPEAGAATRSTTAVLESAYSAWPIAMFVGNLVVTLIISGAIAVALIVAVLKVWDAALESVLPIRRWLR